MNSNPFPQDLMSGQIKPLEEFDLNTPKIEVSIEAQKLLENIPMDKRVEFLANSIEPELLSEREQLKVLFDKMIINTKKE